MQGTPGTPHSENISPHPIACPPSLVIKNRRPVVIESRWPIWAGAIAIFLLGLSAGMLIERGGPSTAKEPAPHSSTQKNPTINQEHPRRSSKSDREPGQPQIPRFPTNRRRAQLTPLPPPMTRNDKARRSAPVPGTGFAFIEQLITGGCKKAISCGVIPSQGEPICHKMLGEMVNRQSDFKRKLDAGDCAYNSSAAQKCLAAVDQLDCAALARGLNDIPTLAGLLTSCSETVTCL